MEATNYDSLLKIASSLFEGIKNNITILSNASALLNEFLEDINWVGFYLFENNQLELGPFQGKVACMVIPLNKGVCGLCAKTKKTQLVKNVHEFKGHIACDARSNSEIVIPIFVNENFYGVLDIDSPLLSRFDEIDKENLEKFVLLLQNHLN